MTDHSKMKAADRQKIVKRLITFLKKRYGGGVPKGQKPVMESLLFAALLEDVPRADAEPAYEALIAGFHEFNEIRVSMVSEIEEVLAPHVSHAGMRGLRVREVLQFAFEKNYDFHLDEIKRLTLDAGLKELDKIPHATAFMKAYAVQNCMGAHVIPLDERTLRMLDVLKVCDRPGAADEMKSCVRKSDGLLVAHLLHEAASDSALNLTTDRDAEPADAARRLEQAFKPVRKKPKKAVAVSKVVKKPSSARKPAARGAKPAKAKPSGVKKKVSRPKRVARR
jgi:endonuclease-3